jgi:hypothetical protein
MSNAMLYNTVLALLGLIVVSSFRVPLSIQKCNRQLFLMSDEDTASSTAGKGFGKKVVPNVTPLTESANRDTSTVSTEVPMASSSPEVKNLYNTPRARREAELDEKIQRLREEEELLATDPSVGAVPELIADRMIGRIATFFGVPVFGGKQLRLGLLISDQSLCNVLHVGVFVRQYRCRVGNIRWSVLLFQKV